LPDAAEAHIKNEYLYNDKELIDDADLNWYDYGFRSYDPQIGRFTQLDPLTDDYPELTPYQYASCEPIGNIDIDGLEGESALTAATAKTLQEVIVTGSTKVISLSNKAAQIGLKILDVVTDAIPIVSGIKDIYNGIKEGNWLDIAIGVVSIVADVVTLGGSSIAKGVIKTAIKEGSELLSKDLIKEGLKEGVEKGFKEIVEKETKEVVEKNVKKEAKGIIYKRTNPKTGEEYIGQAKSDKRFLKRQKEHDKKIGIKHKYDVLDRAKPGKKLNVAEKTHIRRGGGIKKNGGKLENKRHQMSDKNYKKAGGTEPYPTRCPTVY
jgi:RHS repeat-associated protein